MLALVLPAGARAQSFEVLGTRAAGMGGAFVAVADDATAVYWNPAGLALGGSYFSLVLDGSQAEAETENAGPAGRRSAGIIALSTLPLGLSYYRLSASSVTPTANPQRVQLERLTTHHAGLTLVQSLSQYIAVGGTAKLVHGYAATGVVPDGDRDDLLDGAGDLPDRSTTKFDVDVGVMALLGSVRAGVTVRNLAEPDFSTADGGLLTLRRQTRAGVSYVGVTDLVVAADVDIERAKGSLGEVRDIAAGAEARRLQARLAQERLSLQHAGRRAGWTRPGLQPRRQRDDVPIAPRRRTNHVRLAGRRPRLGRRRAPGVLSPAEAGRQDRSASSSSSAVPLPITPLELCSGRYQNCAFEPNG